MKDAFIELNIKIGWLILLLQRNRWLFAFILVSQLVGNVVEERELSLFQRLERLIVFDKYRENQPGQQRKCSSRYANRFPGVDVLLLIK